MSAMENNVNGATINKKNGFASRAAKRKIFYWLMIAIPLLQVIIFYGYVNFNSLILAFQEYKVDAGTGRFYTVFSLANFKDVWAILTANINLIKNSMVITILEMIFGLGLGIFFSFYIYKKYPGASFFKVILFLPSVLSGVILTLLFKYITGDVYVYLAKFFGATNPVALFNDPEMQFFIVLFYAIWISFGGVVLLLGGTMSGINEAVVESARLEGVNFIQEFWYITVPMVFPTIVTFIIVRLSAFFTNSFHLYTFFEGAAPVDIQTFGYKFFVDTKAATYVKPAGSDFLNRRLTYSEMAAVGLVFSALTYLVISFARWIANKWGPSVD